MQEEEKVDWLRKGKKADLTDVDAHKLAQAARERGIRINLSDDSEPGKRTAEVHKVVIKGMPGPFNWLGKLFRRKKK